MSVDGSGGCTGMLLLELEIRGADVDVKMGEPVSLMRSRLCLVVRWQTGRSEGLGILAGFWRLVSAFESVGGCDMVSNAVVLLED
jgi:hypothetical protein